MESAHPGTAGRWRTWIFRADAGLPEYEWLRPCIIRVNTRTVFIDDARFTSVMAGRVGLPPTVSRRTRTAARDEAA